MDDGQRKELHAWFKKHKSYGTYHVYSPNKERDEYVIGKCDVDDFCDLLRENMLDIVGIPCMIGGGGIWFKRTDLDKADFY